MSYTKEWPPDLESEFLSTCCLQKDDEESFKSFLKDIGSVNNNNDPFWDEEDFKVEDLKSIFPAVTIDEIEKVYNLCDHDWNTAINILMQTNDENELLNSDEDQSVMGLKEMFPAFSYEDILLCYFSNDKDVEKTIAGLLNQTEAENSLPSTLGNIFPDLKEKYIIKVIERFDVDCDLDSIADWLTLNGDGIRLPRFGPKSKKNKKVLLSNSIGQNCCNNTEQRNVHCGSYADAIRTPLEDSDTKKPFETINIQTYGFSNLKLASSDQNEFKSSHYRALAYDAYSLRKENYQKAMESFKRGKLGRSSAIYYAEEGRKAHATMTKLNEKASERIFLENNPGFPNINVIDLHGLYISEAVRFVDEILVNNFYNSSHKRKSISFITGVGNHSDGGHSKLRTALLAHLHSKKWDFHCLQRGAFCVTGSKNDDKNKKQFNF